MIAQPTSYDETRGLTVTVLLWLESRKEKHNQLMKQALI